MKGNHVTRTKIIKARENTVYQGTVTGRLVQHYQSPRKEGKSVMAGNNPFLKVFDDFTKAPAREFLFLYDSRKGIIAGDRAYGYYQTLYAFHPDEPTKDQWTLRRGNWWPRGWMDCTEDRVPAVVRLAATMVT